MLPLKKIVCPTDFSEPSFEALQAAVELARHFSAELIVVHVVQPIPVVAAEHMSPAAFNVPAYQAEMELSSRRLLKEQLEGNAEFETRSAEKMCGRFKPCRPHREVPAERT